ncbi:hypothetical protein KTE91_33115 [Burkholderia multivorans]|uniref:hypothetical protein n=1 Tax=Burkholderia multivorans TaxID=87883 RepID=UPI001C24042C|nr:hypothetical protein [Burkholderia multivorans]MBU9439919.1 hypothetical protein [Burkholderia multivorans]
MSNIDTEKMKALAAELRANHEAMKSWMPTHQLESSPASKGADAIDTLLDECALLRSRVNALSDLVDSLLAARRACASEFPPDAEGEPDEGRIHENIRKLKAALEAAAADKRDGHRYRELLGLLLAGDIPMSESSISLNVCGVSPNQEEFDEAVDFLLAQRQGEGS